MQAVLITGAGGPAGIAVARQARTLGLRVVGVDMAPVPAGLVDEAYLVPPADDPSFLPALRQMIDLSGVDAVIPTVQEELPFVAAAAAHLGVPVAVAGVAAVVLAQDKLTTAWALAAAGVPVPAFCAAEDVTTPQEPTWLRPGQRVVLKPRVCGTGRGVDILDAGRQLREIAPRRPGAIVQEFVPGSRYRPQVYLHAASGESEVVVLEKGPSGADSDGLGAARPQVVDAAQGAAREIATVAAEAVRALGLVGPIDLDVRRRADGTPVVLGVTARFGANSCAAPRLFERAVADLRAAASLRGAA